MTEETLCAMALTCIPRLSQRQALEIFRSQGNSAVSLFSDTEEQLKVKMSGISPVVLGLLFAGRKGAYERAQKEREFARKHQIQCLCYGSDAYPQRLYNCDDAPLVLYYRGNADLNCTYALSMVGTRSCTEYGKDMCQRIVTELQSRRPDVLIVSGLAYGIDICSHRQALSAGLKTVGVLAHGLDRIYPASHRDTAKTMMGQGGLLTEYMTGTRPERGNFLSRNRIVAGLSDGCLVVESGATGGSLVTARISQDYGRDVLAVPGRVGDTKSEGCNRLIARNTAALVTNGDDVLQAMNWPSAVQEKQISTQPVEQNLFAALSEEETLVTRLLAGNDGKQINQLVVESDMPVARVSAILFELEMKGVVRLMAGGRYHLILR